jgi:hypothetical protein
MTLKWVSNSAPRLDKEAQNSGKTGFVHEGW